MESRSEARDEEMERLLARFVDWAGRQEDIRAAFVIGSRARRDIAHDEFSDLDLPFFCADPSKYLKDDAWLREIGVPLLDFQEPTSDGRDTERRVMFEPDLDVDFVPLPAALLDEIGRGDPHVLARRMAGEPGFTRGHLVVLDKDGALRGLDMLPKDGDSRRAPVQDPYDRVVDEFMYRAVWTARKLARGELWVAKMSLDSDMKALLLRMMEWHASAKGGADTWHGGRFIERWADPAALSRLGGTFAAYDASDVERALLASVELFCDLAADVAARAGLEHASEKGAKARALVENALSSRRGKVK
jgi:aminoglycoside 6-adenylyltransferase